MRNSVRVGNELGAGHPKSASFSVVVVNTVSLIISIIAAIIMLLLSDIISYAFTKDDTVAKAVSDLCPFLAVTLILNGVQPILSGKHILKHEKINIGCNNYKMTILSKKYKYFYAHCICNYDAQYFVTTHLKSDVRLVLVTACEFRMTISCDKI